MGKAAATKKYLLCLLAEADKISEPLKRLHINSFNRYF